ncbi:3-hydroxyisobutyrate dehydrogenase [Paenarthrobacter nitroguajacolicus]|uniref:3-hydroxyisobutyrate dehydrogenase n=1 Tax=Paenarthrobacter nitroguajacolicus TaxID=211146 RepID=UPI00248C678E|nr:3-hydroxyisobutyrate dehydrogenase [Paenarthrobacter nitroguajacolicus]MDI2035588.1 putative 3-hydroxyisobutyrate dehydrogenase [Paenarthrobacter nitroguajacolicus]
MTTRIAFIGLGHMGGPMAANLVKAGYEVSGFDLAPSSLDQARTSGIKIAESAIAAVEAADVVITMLPAGRHVLELYSGTAESRGLLSAASPDTLFIDCSTIAVADSLSAHSLAASAGQRCLEAPVSGGVAGATAGTLTFMVGGLDSDFTQAGPLLETMGKRQVYCGGPGTGQAAKICNNMVLGITMIAVSEAFVLGERLGVGNDALFDVMANASGQCWALTSNCPVPGPVPASPANHDFRPGFASTLMAKDMNLAAEAQAYAGLQDVGLGGRAAAMYREFSDGEGATQDFSAIINAIRSKADESDSADRHTLSATDAA